ncbi:MAG: hypothetical protein JSU68_14365 [Phycisphaerales bacterium]|nr:MAG: hypothetical protein JSU68_14365 [Phycisphaerales bacterium]
MRSALLRAVAGLVLVALGCSVPSGVQESPQAELQPMIDGSEPPATAETQPVMLARQVEPYLLFDRRPSPVYVPENFAIRRTWPVAERGFSAGEWVEFEERLIDRERGFNHTNDLTYRRFSSRRQGVTFR